MSDRNNIDPWWKAVRKAIEWIVDKEGEEYHRRAWEAFCQGASNELLIDDDIIPETK